MEILAPMGMYLSQKQENKKKKEKSAKGNTSFSQSKLQRESIRPREYLYKTEDIGYALL